MSYHVQSIPLKDTSMKFQLDLFTVGQESDDAAASSVDASPPEVQPAALAGIDPNLRQPANDIVEGESQQPIPTTLEDAKSFLDHLPLESGKRAELKSAVNTFCKAVGMTPAKVTTEVFAISKLIAGVMPAMVGLKHKRWERVRSLLLTTLRLCGVKVMPGRTTTTLCAAWGPIFALLKTAQQRYGISRFIHWVSEIGVEPGDISAEHFEVFREALLAESLHQKPKAIYRTTVRTWNMAAANVAGWPRLTIDLEPDPRLYSLPLADFPRSFIADQEAFLERCGNPDPLAADYYKRVSPSTNDVRRRQIRQLASALVGSGFPIDKVEDLAVLVAEPNAKAALGYLYDRRGKVTSNHISSQADLLRTIAQHWVKTRVDDIRLSQMVANLRMPNTGMKAKNRKRLLQFDLPDNVYALLNLPSRIFREVQAKPTGSRDEALRIMSAVVVEILIMAPMRLRNVAEIEIGKHLIESRRGGAVATHIVLPSAATKTNVAYEMPLPKDSQALIQIYITTFRSRVFAGPCSHLFPGRNGGCRSLTQFSSHISKFILKETGIVMNPHLFRHLAGKLYLDANPNDIETVRRLLSHSSTTTTLRSYVTLTATHAIQRYDNLVSRLRSGLPPAPGPALNQRKGLSK